MKKNQIIFWAVCVVSGILILIVNLNFESKINQLFHQNQFDLLNQLSSRQTNQSLDFYIGQIEDSWVGPISNAVGFLLFVSFALLYLREASAKTFALSIFGFLILTKLTVLFYPPYGDAIGGPFAEGIWLAKHNFDYFGLARQPNYDMGGARVYFFSIYPTYLAMLFKLIPWSKPFLAVNHLLVYAMAAVVVSLIRELVGKVFDRRIGALSAIFVLALPLFQSQTEAINMEMPCLFFSMIAVYYLAIKRIGAASIYAIIAAFTKGHGILVCGAVFFVSFILFLFDEKYKKQWPVIGFGLLAVLGALFKVFSKFLLKDQHAAGGLIKLFAGWPSFVIFYHPILYVVSLVAFIILICARAKKIKNIFILLCDQYYIPFVIFVTAGMWYALFLNFEAVSPRYHLELKPFLVLGVLFVLLDIKWIRKLSPLFLIIAIGIASFSSFGFFYHPLPANYHVLQERSLEYRNELKMNMRLVKLLESKYSQYTIGAPFLMAQMLAMPELGYVKKPMDVLAYGMPIAYENIKRFEGLNKNIIMNTVWVGLAAQFINRKDFKFPVHPKDQVLEEMVLGNNRIVLFRGGIAIEQRRLMAQQMMRK